MKVTRLINTVRKILTAYLPYLVLLWIPRMAFPCTVSEESSFTLDLKIEFLDFPIHCCGTKAGLIEIPFLLYIQTFPLGDIHILHREDIGREGSAKCLLNEISLSKLMVYQ